VYITSLFEVEMMNENNMLNYVKDVLENLPVGWLGQTTHRLDLYNENMAKSQFLEEFEYLFRENNSELAALSELPTAYDYIRLGHPLSCLLEWVIANLNKVESNNVISFSSKTIAVLAILRKNQLENKNTQIVYTGDLPKCFNIEVLRSVYAYKFDLNKVEKIEDIVDFNGSTIYLSQDSGFSNMVFNDHIDFTISVHSNYGSIVLVNGEKNESYISEVQHVRRRETIAMTPANSLAGLKQIIKNSPAKNSSGNIETNKALVIDSIKEITGANTKALLGSCGLSIQYAILMGLVHDALEKHKGKDIKIIVPPNCYGGTNDQARRVAACISNVEVLDLPVDGGQDMVQSINKVLAEVANEDAIPYIIAEIPTNPRVEVPELEKLREVLSKERKTKDGQYSVAPVFILDQTFCPNVHFLGEKDILSSIKTISYVSGSKFPSGGLCTAGYCVANKKAESLMAMVNLHLKLCDNEATDLQVEILAKQLPSMNQRINDAYKNTREFVNYIKETLPDAKINFVSEELASGGFTPSVFSLDLPTKGSTSEEKETYKRELNYKLINLMINKIPQESKHCVSYGQLKGCYWTIPATSTQGTTKEGDKDYIVRIAISPDMDVAKHKDVFLDFVNNI